MSFQARSFRNLAPLGRVCVPAPGAGKSPPAVAAAAAAVVVVSAMIGAMIGFENPMKMWKGQGEKWYWKVQQVGMRASCWRIDNNIIEVEEGKKWVGGRKYIREI